MIFYEAMRGKIEQAFLRTATCLIARHLFGNQGKSGLGYGRVLGSIGALSGLYRKNCKTKQKQFEVCRSVFTEISIFGTAKSSVGILSFTGNW